MLKVKWTESNRVSELEFTSEQDFADWLKEQALYSGETLEVL